MLGLEKSHITTIMPACARGVQGCKKPAYGNKMGRVMPSDGSTTLERLPQLKTESHQKAEGYCCPNKSSEGSLVLCLMKKADQVPLYTHAFSLTSCSS